MRPVQTETTSTQRLATVLLGRDVREWILEERCHPYRPSFKKVAEELERVTNGVIQVTPQTVRLWVTDAAETNGAT